MREIYECQFLFVNFTVVCQRERKLTSCIQSGDRLALSAEKFVPSILRLDQAGVIKYFTFVSPDGLPLISMSLN